MPCNCAGLQTKKCSCKILGYPLKTSHQAPLAPFPTQFVLGRLEHEHHTYRTGDPCSQQLASNNLLFQLVEGLYDRCAAYNLRYCPLRRASYNDKHVTRAAKDLAILTCFLLANLVVFLNLATITLVHLFLLLKEVGFGIKKYLSSSESSNIPVIVQVSHDGTPTLPTRHDFSPEPNRYYK